MVWRISELLRCASYNLWSYSKEERSTSCSSTVCFIIITDHNKTDRKKQSRSQKLFINLHLDIFLIFLLARVGKAQAMWSSFCRTSPPTAPFLFCSFCLSLALQVESWGIQMQSSVLPVSHENNNNNHNWWVFCAGNYKSLLLLLQVDVTVGLPLMFHVFCAEQNQPEHK